MGSQRRDYICKVEKLNVGPEEAGMSSDGFGDHSPSVGTLKEELLYGVGPSVGPINEEFIKE